MAFKLTKTEAKTGLALLGGLELATVVLNEAIGTFNEGLSALRSDLQDVIDDYNEQLDGIREFAADVGGRFEDEIDQKSDRWRESDAAGVAVEIRDTWRGLNIEDIEIDFPEEIDIAAEDCKIAFGDLLDGLE